MTRDPDVYREPRAVGRSQGDHFSAMLFKLNISKVLLCLSYYWLRLFQNTVELNEVTIE